MENTEAEKVVSTSEDAVGREQVKKYNPLVSLVVPFGKSELGVAKLLTSIFSQTVDPDFIEVIAVDCGENKEAVDAIKPFFNKTNPIMAYGTAKSYSIAQAANVGIDKASGKYIWMLSEDGVLQEGALAEIKPLLDGKNDCVCVAWDYGENAVMSEDMHDRYSFLSSKSYAPWERIVLNERLPYSTGGAVPYEHDACAHFIVVNNCHVYAHTEKCCFHYDGTKTMEYLDASEACVKPALEELKALAENYAKLNFVFSRSSLLERVKEILASARVGIKDMLDMGEIATIN